MWVRIVSRSTDAIANTAASVTFLMLPFKGLCPSVSNAKITINMYVLVWIKISHLLVCICMVEVPLQTFPSLYAYRYKDNRRERPSCDPSCPLCHWPNRRQAQRRTAGLHKMTGRIPVAKKPGPMTSNGKTAEARSMLGGKRLEEITTPDYRCKYNVFKGSDQFYILYEKYLRLRFYTI